MKQPAAAVDKKLDSCLMQTGIKDRARARSWVRQHFSSQAGKYPYVLFCSNTLYLFTVDGLSTAEYFWL